MLRLLRSLSATVPALALAGCATMNVSSHVERGLDFARYRTYDWGPADALPTGDPRLDKDPFFQDRVQGAVERGLAAKGLERSMSSETPDLLIHYHANISQRIDVDRLDRNYGSSGDVRVVDYEAGTLVLDVVDSRTNRIIWRGWAQNSVKDMLDDQDTMARKIDRERHSAARRQRHRPRIRVRRR